MTKSTPWDSTLFFGRDLLTLILAFLFSDFYINESKPKEPEWAFLISIVLIWLVIGYGYRLYDLKTNDKANTYINNYVRVYFLLIVVVYYIFTSVPYFIPSRNIAITTITGLPIIGIPLHFILITAYHKFNKVVSYQKHTLIAGVGSTAVFVEKMLSIKDRSQNRIKGFIKCKCKEECIINQDKVIGDLNNLSSYLKNNTVDEIVIALPPKSSKKIKKIISVADYHGVRVKYIPDYRALFGDNYKVTYDGSTVAINIRQLPLDGTFALILKNSFDKIFASVALLLLLPILILIAILIKLDSPGPIFYCPIRIGKSGRPFRMIKFRSMLKNDPALGGKLSTTKNDCRISRLGKVLRKYSLDELPQFINVIYGNMSVVGPRPHRSYLNQQLQASVDKYMIRHYYKPGITGWAQVNGWRGPTETLEQKEQRTLHDIWYMENWSFWLDIKIIFMTVFNRNVHKQAF